MRNWGAEQITPYRTNPLAGWCQLYHFSEAPGGKGPRWTRDSVSRLYHFSHYREAVGHDSCGLFYEHNGFHRAQEFHSVKKLHALPAKLGAKSQQTWP